MPGLIYKTERLVMEEHLEFLRERYELAMERIRQIKDEHVLASVWEEYFVTVAAFLERVEEYVTAGPDALLYEAVLAQNYETSYVNPAYAVKRLGEDYGRLLAAVFLEMHSLIELAARQNLEEMVIRPELFVEMYGACVCEWQESGRMPEYETLRQILYWYVSDYSDITMERQFKEKTAWSEETTERTMGNVSGPMPDMEIHPAVKVPIRGILQDEDWLKESFLWDKALAKRRREVADTLQEK